ncbi:PepSY domain-containing protein [Gilvimarinus agarilyticus]|uniref:PepSY-associated TM helix domain-containing protein n=1 Tax=Gilvimarinus sp. 2_MG-2023 TaxID=3062666 RepID=UPI001C09CF69|nr:PepSY-associated TM helix domain-containing protein [Gilvimarinus sp. 2_MG-2023]MBU2887441.1 PepSY domain-containing protein [Gilvimarinus agarilyticus]MDO6572100.1 PepSY-associated TM helix domain-containing protein [Gilvimarinus sp. 2_MG-2023]
MVLSIVFFIAWLQQVSVTGGRILSETYRCCKSLLLALQSVRVFGRLIPLQIERFRILGVRFFMVVTSRKFWRKMHLWLAITSAVPLLITALTGVLLAYQPTLERLLEPQYFAVNPQGKPMTLKQAAQRLKSYAPGIRLHYVGVPKPDEARPYASFVSVPNSAGGRDHFNLYLNGYTGELVRRTSEGPVNFILALHRNLTIGPPGRYIVGGASLLLMVLSLVGVYLWWPMRRSTVKRLRKQNDSLSWHNVLGLVTLPIVFLLAFTGITLTFNKQVMPVVRAVTFSPMPPKPPKIFPIKNPKLTLLDAIDVVQSRFKNTDISALGDRGGEKNTYGFWLRRPGQMHPSGWEQIFIHPNTGETVALNNRYSHSPASAYERSWYTWHTGVMLGLAGQILWSLVSGALVAVVITGLVFWWRRRPVKKNQIKQRAVTTAAKVS